MRRAAEVVGGKREQPERDRNPEAVTDHVAETALSGPQVDRQHKRHHDHEQPPVRTQEMKAAAGEVHPQRATGRERAGEQHRQERAQPAGSPP